MTVQTPPFSQWVASPEWRSAATEWIADGVARSGRRMAGPVRQPRIRPWSTQLVVATDHGDVWFKATCRAARFEAEVHQLLSRLLPDRLQRPLAIDARRGWLLTADHGEQPLEDTAAETADWRALVREGAHWQQRLASHGPELLEAGLPDCSPATVPERFDRLLEALERLPAGRRSSLDAGEATRFRRRRGELVDACAALCDSPLPATFQHGDLHWGNAWGSREQPRLFDFGDASWAAAVESLAVPRAVALMGADVRWSEVVAAYLEVWDLDHTAWGVAWNAATFTHAVNRAVSWWGSLQEATDAEWEQWGEAPLAHLREMMRT